MLKRLLSVLAVFVLLIALAGSGIAFAGSSPNSAGAPEAPLLLDWTLRNASGFGDKNNAAVSALEVFGGQLYAGTTNDLGAQIWRTADGDTWSHVPWPASFSSFGHGVLFDMIVFNGKLYAGVGTWYPLGTTGQIWRTSDGVNWELVTGAWEQNANNAGVTNFAMLGGALYVTTNNPVQGIEVYRSPSGNPNDWVRVASTSFGLGNAYPLSTGLVSFNSSLYVALEGKKGGAGARVYYTSDGTNWAPANAPGFGNSANYASGGMAAHLGFLYAGTRNDVAGGQIWRSSDGTNWQQVATSGFGNAANSKIEGFVSALGTLFAFTYNEASGTEVWSTVYGGSWERSNAPGFGSASNKAVALWSNGSDVLSGLVYLGTFNQAVGGEIWSATPAAIPPLPYRLYLPLIRRR